MSSSEDEALPALQRESSTEEVVESEIAAARKRLGNNGTAVDALLNDEDSSRVQAAVAAATNGTGSRVPNPGANPDEATDDDEDEEDKPYGKKAVKKMMEKMSKPVDPSFADSLEPDEEGYKPITWTQLSDVFSYERQAHGFKLYGDISQKDREHWDRSKQIKIRDRDGREGAVFFYDEESKPYFDWDDVQVGNEIVVKSPRFHRFLDGQEGMRLESNKSVARVAKRRFTDLQRLDYGRLNKANGNGKFEKKKYDDAIQCYETAISHLQGTFHQNPEHEQEARELTAQCFLNIAACQIGQGRHRVVEVACRSALRINASQALNAKAYFRIGQAALKLHELAPAREALTKAADLAPGDAAVAREIEALNAAIAADAAAQKELFNLNKTDKKFGLKRTVFGGPPAALDGVSNFRDVGGKDIGPNLRVPRHMLYRCAQLGAITKSGFRVLTEELRVKTILDLRTSAEIKATYKRAVQDAKKYNASNDLEIALYKKTGGARGLPPKEAINIEQHFVPIAVSCKPPVPPVTTITMSHPGAKGKSREEVMAGPVVIRLDMSNRAVKALASWWTLVCAIFLGILSIFYPPMLRHAAAVMIKGTALRVGIRKYYETTLDLHGPEIAYALEIASHEENYPILVHCSMGKDRTGLVVALILAAAGLDDAAIAAEYGAVVPPNENDKSAEGEWSALGLDADWRVANKAVMADVLAAVRAKHGSIHAYLDSIGINAETRDRIRAVLARPPPQRKA